MKDYFGYKGKVCVVTGASSGMGKATVEMLLDLGAKVYALDVNECSVKGIEKFVKVNLANKQSIDEAFAVLPEKIDCFFGVAGVSGVKTDYTTTFNINYTANMYACEKYLKDRLNAGGSITIVSSTSGVSWKEYLDECKQFSELHDWDSVQTKLKEVVPEGTPANLAYIYSKRVVIAYANSLALELSAKGIRVNTVLPGSTDTGMKDEFAALAGGIENMIRFAGRAGRLATSEEMANTIVFLGSNMASFISGEEIFVDYCDNAMIKLGIKPNMCAVKALMSKEELQQIMLKMKGNH
jgi:NAD(P)-dependent dehydrogenase (short-subunit alcohol dehydrogenase family)